jgi:hypothetical protein
MAKVGIVRLFSPFGMPRPEIRSGWAEGFLRKTNYSEFPTTSPLASPTQRKQRLAPAVSHRRDRAQRRQFAAIRSASWRCSKARACVPGVRGVAPWPGSHARGGLRLLMADRARGPCPDKPAATRRHPSRRRRDTIPRHSSAYQAGLSLSTARNAWNPSLSLCVCAAGGIKAGLRSVLSPEPDRRSFWASVCA